MPACTNRYERPSYSSSSVTIYSRQWDEMIVSIRNNYKHKHKHVSLRLLKSRAAGSLLIKSRYLGAQTEGYTLHTYILRFKKRFGT